MKSQKCFFVTGTDTHVGKTVVTACLISLFRAQGLRVGVAKPFESGGTRDSDWLRPLTGQPRQWDKLAFPYHFKTPMAPAMAAEKEGVRLAVRQVIKGLWQLAQKVDVLLVEGAGGLLVPVKDHYMVADFIKDLGYPALVVSRLGLGTINHSLLSVEALKKRHCAVAGWVFSQSKFGRPTDLEKLNPEVIARLSRLPIIGKLPYLAKANRRQLPRVEELRRYFLMNKLGTGST